MDLNNEDQSIKLSLPAQASFMPLAQDCVESASKLLGLSGGKLMRLSLAIEEIFLHLVRVSRGGEKNISLSIRPGAISVDVQFELQSETLDLRAMNIVSSDDVQSLLEQEDFDNIGLLIASRFIDTFFIKSVSRYNYSLLLRQEKEYPQIKKSEFVPFVAKPPFTVDTQPQPSSLHQACIQALALYPEQLFNTTFKQPGRLSDLVSGGELAALVLQDSIGSISGLLIWELKAEKSVVFHGPYIFTENLREEVAQQLSDVFINMIARSQAIITFSRQATNELPVQQFESLGQMQYCLPEDKCLTLQACYRHLRDDDGEAIWADPSLLSFLKKEYERLVLIRDIREVGEHGERKVESSVFAVELNKENSVAILKPMIDGMDIKDNIGRHVTNLLNENIHNIICILDLGVGWQAAISGALLEQGFTAQFILPLAGVSDNVVFQYTQDCS